MDFANSISAYTDLYASQAGSSGKLEGSLKSDYSGSTDEELMDACKQFEAYFLEQVFKEMQKTVPKSADSSDNALTEYFQDRYLQEIAGTSTETNSLGLAQMLYEQMRRNYGMDSPSAPSTDNNPQE